MFIRKSLGKKGTGPFSDINVTLLQLHAASLEAARRGEPTSLDIVTRSPREREALERQAEATGLTPPAP